MKIFCSYEIIITLFCMSWDPAHRQVMGRDCGMLLIYLVWVSPCLFCRCRGELCATFSSPSLHHPSPDWVADVPTVPAAWQYIACSSGTLPLSSCSQQPGGHGGRCAYIASTCQLTTTGFAIHHKMVRKVTTPQISQPCEALLPH